MKRYLLSILAIVMAVALLSDPTPSGASAASDAYLARIAVSKAAVDAVNDFAMVNSSHSAVSVTHANEFKAHVQLIAAINAFNLYKKSHPGIKVIPVRVGAVMPVGFISQDPQLNSLIHNVEVHTILWKQYLTIFNNAVNAFNTWSRVYAGAEVTFAQDKARAYSTSAAVAPSPNCPPTNPYASASSWGVLQAPGVTLRQFSSYSQTPMFVANINLSGPGVRASVGPTINNSVNTRHYPVEMTTLAKATLGTNGDFFDLGTNPTGHDLSANGMEVMRGGGVVKTTSDPSQPTFYVGSNGIAGIGNVQTVVTINRGSSTVSANSLNSHYLPQNGIAVFDARWSYPVRVRPSQPLRQYLVNRAGQVVSVLPDSRVTAMPLGGHVIYAQGLGMYRMSQAGIGLGSFIGIRASAPGIYSAIGTGHELLRGGQFMYLHCDDNYGTYSDRQGVARTILGLKPGGREMILVVVQGKSDGQGTLNKDGITPREAAGLMRGLGAYDAIMLDGGGSSAMVAKMGGRYLTLSKYASNTPRFVPEGFGVWAG